MHGLDPPARDAGTIVRNHNRESNQEQGALWENKGELNKDMKKEIKIIRSQSTKESICQQQLFGMIF